MIRQNKDKFTAEHIQLLMNHYYKFGNSNIVQQLSASQQQQQNLSASFTMGSTSSTAPSTRATEDAEFLIHLYYYTYPAMFHQHWKNVLEASELDKSHSETAKMAFVLKYCTLLLSKSCFFNNNASSNANTVPQLSLLDGSLERLVKLSLASNDLKNILLLLYIMQELLLIQPATIAAALLPNVETIANSNMCKNMTWLEEPREIEYKTCMLKLVGSIGYELVRAKKQLAMYMKILLPLLNMFQITSKVLLLEQLKALQNAFEPLPSDERTKYLNEVKHLSRFTTCADIEIRQEAQKLFEKNSKSSNGDDDLDDIDEMNSSSVEQQNSATQEIMLQLEKQNVKLAEQQVEISKLQHQLQLLLKKNAAATASSSGTL